MADKSSARGKGTNSDKNDDDDIAVEIRDKDKKKPRDSSLVLESKDELTDLPSEAKRNSSSRFKVHRVSIAEPCEDDEESVARDRENSVQHYRHSIDSNSERYPDSPHGDLLF